MSLCKCVRHWETKQKRRIELKTLWMPSEWSWETPYVVHKLYRPEIYKCLGCGLPDLLNDVLMKFDIDTGNPVIIFWMKECSSWVTLGFRKKRRVPVAKRLRWKWHERPLPRTHAATSSAGPKSLDEAVGNKELDSEAVKSFV